MMPVIRNVRMGLGIGAAAVALMAVPQIAEANTPVFEGCLVSRANTLCTDPAGDGDAQWTATRYGAYSSGEGYFQYHGTGPWTIQHSDGTISCPAQTTCQRFIPPVVVPQYTQLLIQQSGNGVVFAGALSTGPED
jgi:hypothetical protein